MGALRFPVEVRFVDESMMFLRLHAAAQAERRAVATGNEDVAADGNW